MNKPLPSLPKVALLGRPNVGKSTLFNVLSVGRENKAITHAQAGTTRDIRRTPAQILGRPFMLLDTAGVEKANKENYSSNLQRELNVLSLNAAKEADVLVLLLDGSAPLTAADRGLVSDLRKLNKPLLLVVNKADLKRSAATVDEADSLGLGAPIVLSAAHREGMTELAEALAPYLPAAAPLVPEPDEAWEDFAALLEAPEAIDTDPDASPEDYADEGEASNAPAVVRVFTRPVPSPLKLAVLGRPNVGKSTLVNALLREEAMLTGPTAGLTREAITHNFRALEHDFALIDTPGLRKRGKVDDESLEFLSVGQSLAALNHAHVLLLVIDASVHNQARGLWQVFEQQDAAIAQAALRAQKPIILVLNKWDAVEDKAACKADVLAQLRAKLHGIHTPLALPISATKGQGLGVLMKEILALQASYGQAFNTARLNRALAKILAKRSPPLVGGRPVSLKFLRQICSAPPTFALWGNRVDNISGHYLQFLKHQLSESLGLTALPITLHLRTNKNPYGVGGKAGGKGSGKTRQGYTGGTGMRKGVETPLPGRPKPTKQVTVKAAKPATKLGGGKPAKPNKQAKRTSKASAKHVMANKRRRPAE